MPPTLIVRLPNWLGDTVMAVPALRALRAQRPEARLVLAGPWVSLLADQDLGGVLVQYKRSWRHRLATADVVCREAGETAILMPGSLEAALAARYWGARRVVGFATGGRSWLLTDRLPLPIPRRHQVDEYAMLVEHLGVDVADRVPRLSAPAEDCDARRRARALLDESGASARGNGRPLVGIHLGAAWGPAKLWPTERVIELCRLIAEQGGVALLLGTTQDDATGTAVTRAAPAVSLVGRDRPALLPALLTEIDVLVSADTGVAHLAAALGTMAVTLFGPTDPRLTAPRGAATIVQNAVPCAPCFYRVCPIDHPCLRDIDARRVLTAVMTPASPST